LLDLALKRGFNVEWLLANDFSLCQKELVWAVNEFRPCELPYLLNVEFFIGLACQRTRWLKVEKQFHAQNTGSSPSLWFLSPSQALLAWWKTPVIVQQKG
jgi:hypothetical protein